jgi:hypothetical protein
MRQTINFEDNLYFINEFVNTLEQGLDLKLDARFFFDKYIEDLFFLDASINKLYAELIDNPQLVNIQEIQRSLQITKERFARLLERILSGDSSLEEGYLPFEEKLTGLKETHSADVDRIRSQMENREENATPKEGISPEEYQFLFPEEDAENG